MFLKRGQLNSTTRRFRYLLIRPIFIGLHGRTKMFRTSQQVAEGPVSLHIQAYEFIRTLAMNDASFEIYDLCLMMTHSHISKEITNLMNTLLLTGALVKPARRNNKTYFGMRSRLAQLYYLHINTLLQLT